MTRIGVSLTDVHLRIVLYSSDAQEEALLLSLKAEGWLLPDQACQQFYIEGIRYWGKIAMRPKGWKPPGFDPVADLMKTCNNPKPE